MEIIQIDANNIDKEHICCAIGNDKANKGRAQTKKDWLKQRFEEGLIFKRLDERGKVFIEYMPIEKVWKPVVGENYMVINCLWVSGKFKGQGHSTRLLKACIEDAKANNMNGIAVVTSNKVKPFLTDKRFYAKHGFETVDTAPPFFELMVLKFNPDAENPTFSENAKTGTCANKEGFSFIYSNQCPFMEEYVALLADLSGKRGIPSEIIKIKNSEEAKTMGSPFGTLGIYYNGEFKLHELMPEKKFEKFLDTLTQ